LQGKILIIDGISTNRIVLKVKLTTAFYQVVQASTIAEALALIPSEMPDLVLTAVHLPDGSASELCSVLRSLPQTSTLPVLAIACSQTDPQRLETLRAGAFDVMTKPINETLLLGRVRNMIRAHNKLEEWHIRDDTSCALGLSEAPSEFVRPGTISLIGLDAAKLQGWVRHLLPNLRARYCVSILPNALAQLHADVVPDAVVLSLPDTPEQSEDCLRMISTLRASTHTRDIALVVVQNTPDPQRATTALDMGADDVMTLGFDAQELALRLQVLLGRKQQVAEMLDSVRTGLREVGNDPLTGLYNRRYAMPFVSRMIARSASNKTPFAILLADMDYFKRINDAYGHASGDAVLIETARRLRDAVRGTDVVARIGGEEFLIALPATDPNAARVLASRICDTISNTPFAIPGAAEPVHVTISLGLAIGGVNTQPDTGAPESLDALLDRADKALYDAKTRGRNCVTLSQPRSRPAA